MDEVAGPQPRARAAPPLRAPFRPAVLPMVAAMLLTTWLGALPSPAAEIHLYAAASLADVLKELAPPYEARTGDRVLFNFGASGLLSRHIQEGAPADLFFSADEARMDELDQKGLLMPGTRTNRLANTLVLIVPSDSRLPIHTPQDLLAPEVQRVAIADPKTVPAGQYARGFLEQLGLWKGIQGRVIPTGNVRGALAAVESGNVEAGWVYGTDTRLSKGIRTVYVAAGPAAPRIRYPVALIRDSKAPTEARRLLTHLASTDTGKVFEKFGFIPLPPPLPAGGTPLSTSGPPGGRTPGE